MVSTLRICLWIRKAPFLERVQLVLEDLHPTYIAICVWMFSASWSYDLYLVLRDGSYPTTWFPNIFASSVLYLSAGLLWSLENVEGRGVIFGFMDPSWPLVSKSGKFTRIVWYALPFMSKR